MGGLVTTYGAGMAVPDWPNTYGYNLFLYPLASWVGVWDVFLEHSHRLVGASVGMIAIALACALWFQDSRRWMRQLGLVVLAGVIFQGVLGGLRVVGDELFLAKVHGCTAPLFFALCAGMVVFTSPAWIAGRPLPPSAMRPELAGAGEESLRSAARIRKFSRLAGIVSCAIYLQIVAGANLRHLPPDAGTAWFELWVWLHVLGAVAVGGCGVLLLGGAARWLHGHRGLARRAWLLAALVLLQLSLGLASWVVKYGFPAWFQKYVCTLRYTVVAKGWVQALTVTAHVGVGSLCLAAAISLTLWAFYENSYAHIDRLVHSGK
jgi:cytochrome c oxidase assembly protein subunit 15